jgi:cell division protein ZapA
MTDVTVNIFGDEYSISGDATPEEIQRYADYLDGKLSDLNNVVQIDSKYKLAILCGLNLIEEIFDKEEQLQDIMVYSKRILEKLDSFLPEVDREFLK